MAIRCANCRGYFTRDEISRGKPPRHLWPITPAGAQAITDNQRAANGADQWQCPMCGQRSLVF